MKQTPTILRLSFSFRSRLSTSESTNILHSNVAPDVTSMKLSIPKPTREMLPETAPAAIATKPSRKFHTIVKYSSRFPRWAIAWRAIVNSFILGAYQGIIGGIALRAIYWLTLRPNVVLSLAMSPDLALVPSSTRRTRSEEHTSELQSLRH